jgi:hypothetical protein
MTRLLPVLLALAGITCSVASAAPAQGGAEHRAAHFQRVKTFALTALDARLSILQGERECVATAKVPGELRTCHADASKARAVLKANMHPQYEQLQSGRVPQ